MRESTKGAGREGSGCNMASRLTWAMKGRDKIGRDDQERGTRKKGPREKNKRRLRVQIVIFYFNLYALKFKYVIFSSLPNQKRTKCST